ncbi:hypothetical protein R3W88_031676 [Solanum pinnatisectum]|uniref:DC1 domain-containing protein n=1 Tax=Solanum pinnatisectum TaxID=50273 RepID=A0AAV9LLZ7_9SOLN|nr:hypothetical protein R3W88_031676 [Solanum pinnatisectum]
MKGYICVGCNYFIDNICFSLPSMIQHMSHPQHPLKLTWYSEFQNGNLKSPACQYYMDHTSGWADCCTKCDFFVDRFCAGASKTLTLANVNYKLFFSFPFKHEKAIIRCNICFEKVMTTCSLLYYNMDSDETMHVSCALFEESVSNHEEMVNRLSIQRFSDLRIAD